MHTVKLVFGGASAILVFFGTVLSVVFLFAAAHLAWEEANWVRTTGTVVGRVPYTGKKGGQSFYPEYEYELNGGRHRCQGYDCWDDATHTVGNTIELLVQPDPPHAVRFGTSADRWAEQGTRSGVAFGLLVIGAVIGTAVRRRDPTFEHHPARMAGISLMMFAALMLLLTLGGGCGAIRRAGGKATTGVVVSMERPADPQGNPEYLPVFEYPLGDGTVQGRPDRAYRDEPCRVGEAVRLEYDRAKPGRVVWSQCDDGPNFLSPAWLATLFAGILGIVLLIRSAKRSPAHPPAPGANST